SSEGQLGLCILNNDTGKLCREVLGFLRDKNCRLTRDFLVDRSDRPVRVGDDSWPSRVRLFTNPNVQWQAPEKWHVVVAAHPLCAAFAENMLGVPAIRADVNGHVLDDAYDGHPDFVEHFEALAGVDQRDVLRRGDNYC